MLSNAQDKETIQNFRGNSGPPNSKRSDSTKVYQFKFHEEKIPVRYFAGCIRIKYARVNGQAIPI
jgi:hypothetical protein